MLFADHREARDGSQSAHRTRVCRRDILNIFQRTEVWVDSR